MKEAKIKKIINDEMKKYGDDVEERIRIAVREVMKQNDCLYISQVWDDVIQESIKPYFELYPLRDKVRKKEPNVIQMPH